MKKPANASRFIQDMRSRLSKRDSKFFKIMSIKPFALTFLLCCQAVFCFTNCEFNKKFNKERWDKNPDKRYLMEDDIVESRILIGKDSNEVNSILGKSHSSGKRQNGNTAWHYDMGMEEAFFGFPLHYLDIDFVENKVINVSYYVAEI